jgi:hypothetical protein
MRFRFPKAYFLAAACLISFNSSFSQTVERRQWNDSIIDIIDSLKEIVPSIEIASDFANKVVFWGRDFGRKQFGFENSLIFKTGKGFFLNYTGNVWSAMPSPYAKTDIGIGYEKQVTDRLYTSMGYERWFFHNGDAFVRSALTNYLEADINYDLDIINIEPEFYYMFGTQNIVQTDINVRGEFFLFSCFKSGEVSIKPQGLATFANQGFLPIYSDYPSGYTNEKKFNLVDLEMALPLQLKVKNMEFEPQLHYNIPVKIGNEQVSPFFYFSVHFAYNFYFDKGRIKKVHKTLK